MAVLRPYVQQTTAGGGLGPGPDARGVQVESGGAGVSAAASALTQVVVQKQEEDAAVEASLIAAKGAEYWTAEMQRRKDAAEPGAPNFAGALQTDFHTWADDQVKAAKSPKAQQLLQNHFLQFGASLYGEAVGYEAHARLVHTGDRLDETADAGATAVLTNPSLYDLVRDDAMVGVAQVSKTNPQLGVAAAQTLDRKLSVAAVTGRIQSDPARMFKVLQQQAGQSGDSAVERLTEPDRLSLMNQAESEMNRRAAQAKAALAQNRGEFDDRVRDATAALAAGLSAPNPPTRAEFLRYYPGDDGDRRATDFEGYQANQPTLAGAALRPTAELVGAIKAAAPVPGKGFAASQRRQELLASSLAAVVKARWEDPAAVLTAADPSLKAAAAALGPDPSTWAPERARAYAGLLRATQRSLGLPEVVLTRGQAAAAVARYDKQDGRSGAAEILTERARWGADHWPAVWRQLAPDLPGTAWAIGYGPVGMEPNAAARLAEASLLTDEQMTAALPAGVTPKSINDAVTLYYAPFAKTLANQPGAQAMAATQTAAIRQLAFQYASSGSSPNAAAARASREVVNSQFTYLQGPNQSPLRLPVTQPEVGIEDGLRLAQRQVDALDWPAMKDGRWVTRPDNEGVRLMFDGRPVTGRDSKPIEYTWQRLRELGATSAEAEREAAIERGKLIKLMRTK